MTAFIYSCSQFDSVPIIGSMNVQLLSNDRRCMPKCANARFKGQGHIQYSQKKVRIRYDLIQNIHETRRVLSTCSCSMGSIFGEFPAHKHLWSTKGKMRRSYRASSLLSISKSRRAVEEAKLFVTSIS